MEFFSVEIVGNGIIFLSVVFRILISTHPAPKTGCVYIFRKLIFYNSKISNSAAYL